MYLPAGGRGARGIDVLVGLHVCERVIEAGHRAAHQLLVEHLRTCEWEREMIG